MVKASWSNDKQLNQLLKIEDGVQHFKNVKNAVKVTDGFFQRSRICEFHNGHHVCTRQMADGSIYFGYAKDLNDFLKKKLHEEVFKRLGLKEHHKM